MSMPATVMEWLPPPTLMLHHRVLWASTVRENGCAQRAGTARKTAHGPCLGPKARHGARSGTARCRAMPCRASPLAIYTAGAGVACIIRAQPTNENLPNWLTGHQGSRYQS
jgi:hypothetical protein